MSQDTEDRDPRNMHIRAGYLYGLAAKCKDEDDRTMLKRAAQSLIAAKALTEAPSQIYVVVDNDRWGHSTNVVRASSLDAALAFVCSKANRARVEIEELREGEGILWCDDVSPDTPAGD